MATCSLSQAGVVFSDVQTVTGASGASVSSEVFDHYEEGTWTPTWYVATGSITAYGLADPRGFYRKIGNVVFIWGYISYGGQSGSSDSDALRVAGLPFNSISSGFGQSGNQAGGVHMFAETLWASNSPQGGRIQHNTNIINLTHSRTATGTTNVTVGDMTQSNNYSQAVFYGQYLT